MSEATTLQLVPMSNVTVLCRCTYEACGLLILLVLVLSHSSVGMSCDLINGKIVIGRKKFVVHFYQLNFEHR